MKLIIMSKPTFFVEEDKILSTLFEEGLDKLHLYKPESSPLYSERLLSLLPTECYKSIKVHNHFYLKNEFNLGGIHIDNTETAVPEGYKGHFGRTCNDINMLKAAKKKADYVFLKNIFDNPFRNETASFSMDTIKQAARQGLIDKHIYALGGVTIDNIRQAKDMGFGGIVICDDLWNKFDIHNELNYKELITYFIKLRKALS
ncbi:MAG: thiamine phosphate synthase [Prevotella sp.]|nr:thiamine phosphate synthase [Prevotella sp.]